MDGGPSLPVLSRLIDGRGGEEFRWLTPEAHLHPIVIRTGLGYNPKWTTQ
jgi:hypothetical protein